MILYLKGALTVSALLAVIYGLAKFFRKKSPLYIRMIVLGIACTMFGRLFEFFYILNNGSITDGFHVGVLGIIGSFLFFYTANYGQMDTLVDDKTARLRKYRIISLSAPFVVLCIYAVYFAQKGFCEASVVKGCETVIIMLASYYHLKHLIMPDVEEGLIKNIRHYNLVALIYAILCMCEMTADNIGLLRVRVTVALLQCSAVLLILPVVERGVRRWTI